MLEDFLVRSFIVENASRCGKFWKLICSSIALPIKNLTLDYNIMLEDFLGHSIIVETQEVLLSLEASFDQCNMYITTGEQYQLTFTLPIPNKHIHVYRIMVEDFLGHSF